MTVQGVVREWYDDEGWGVLDSEATPGGCWAHCSAVLVAGPRTLEAGQRVTFTAETVDQDGYAYRAVEVWRSGTTPVRVAVDESGTAAMRSELWISLDEP